jgi:hypothetical protein
LRSTDVTRVLPSFARHVITIDSSLAVVFGNGAPDMLLPSVE